MHPCFYDAFLSQGEWVVCRVFQKSSIGKTSPYSLPALPTIESCSDTKLMNELDGIEMSNLSSLVSFSSSFSTISPNDKDMNMNCGLRNYQSLVCPPRMLNSKLTRTNSSTLRALQLNSHRPHEAMDTNINHFAARVECFGTNLSSSFASSGSKNNMDCAAEEKQESIW